MEIGWLATGSFLRCICRLDSLFVPVLWIFSHSYSFPCVLYTLSLFLAWRRGATFHGLCESHAGQIVVTGRGSPLSFGATSCQHGDLSAEVVAAADGRVLVLGVRVHVSLQVPPPPFPLDLRLNLGKKQIAATRRPVKNSSLQNAIKPKLVFQLFNEDLSS